MNFTVGFITLFMILVLPGLIFRRFYFLGEFSKQVSSVESIFRTLVYALIPSVIINVFCLFTFDALVAEVDLGEAIDIHKKLLNPSLLFENDLTTPLMDLMFGKFMWYTLMVYLISFLIGLLSYLFVRGTGLDKKWKILRFKNQWAYTFNGEILLFDKFKSNSNSSLNNRNDLEFMFPYVDILTRNENDESNLFSGYLTDYDLNPERINELDRVYLTETTRYKKGKRVVIPGEFFIILGSQIRNININYIYSNEKYEKNRLKKDKLRNLLSNILVIGFLVSLPLFFIQFEVLGNNSYYNSFFNLSWFFRLALWYVFTINYSFLFPFHKSKKIPIEYYFIGWKTWIKKFFTVVLIYLILGVFIWLFYMVW